MTDIAKYARHYTTIGLGLVPIPLGLKGPREAGWNDPQNAITTREKAHQQFSGAPLNMGVLHSISHTATLDIDHPEWAEMALASVGISLTDLLQAPVRIKGKNGEKPFYRLPDDCTFDRRSLSWPHPTEVMANGKPKLVTVFELRSGAVQDVLPPSIHPDTGKPYEWVGTPPRRREDIPVLPAALQELWENWEEVSAAMRQACPWLPSEAPLQAPARRYRSVSAEGGQRPGDVFRESVSICEVLERNGYQQRGGRYLPPSSKTKVAGVRILSGDDGIERAFSDHGSCPLNDGHAHDSFSAFVILEHAGNITAAVKAAAQKLGLERPVFRQTQPQVMTAEQVVKNWTEAQADLITQGCMVLDAAQGNAKQKTSLFDLWAALTELATTNIWERRGRFYINPGGLVNLKGHGITGRPADISTRLRYLGTLGFHRGVTKVDPNDPASPLLIEIPASPHDLPFMALTQEASKSLTVKVPTFDARRQKRETLHTLTTIRKARPKGSCEDVSCFALPVQTIAALLALPDATIAELAALRCKSVETIRRHVRVLRFAGMVKVVKRRVSLTATWGQLRDVLRIERENDPAFRLSIRRALESTIRYCKAGIFSKPSLPAPALKRRKSMLQVATLRLERLDAGEPISEVMKWAA